MSRPKPRWLRLKEKISAEAHANGHEHCLDILRAVEIVRELLNVAKRKRPAPVVEP